jgi:hypothetical protein
VVGRLSPLPSQKLHRREAQPHHFARVLHPHPARSPRFVAEDLQRSSPPLPGVRRSRSARRFARRYSTVAPSLSTCVAVSGVVDVQRGVPDRPAARRRVTMYGGPNRLMRDSLKADRRIVAEQPQDPMRC